MATILITGGAGYIGSHTCLRLHSAGHKPVVVDNLTNGHRDFVKWGPFERGDIRDLNRLCEIFNTYKPDAIVHFASLIEVGQSDLYPLSFYDNNVSGTISLLKAAEKFGCRNIVFSSTCATYGNPISIPIDEAHPQNPINPYGRTKLMIESILSDLSDRDQIRAVILRYFNAAGSSYENGIGEWHEPESHVIPLAILTALGRREFFTIFGEDYDTPDGTCIRDYVHVLDLAEAHRLAVDHLISGGDSLSVNLGTGVGTSILDLLSTIERQSGQQIPIRRGSRRGGDASVLVADPRNAARKLGWRAAHSLDSIVDSAWKWHTRTELPDM